MNQLLDNFINWDEKDNNKLDRIVSQKYRKSKSFDCFRNIGCIVKFQNDPDSRERTPNSVRIVISLAGGCMVRCYFVDIPFVVANRLLKGKHNEY